MLITLPPWCRQQCVLHYALLCSREKICVPSRPVVKSNMYRPRRRKKKYRPFRSWKKLYTVRSGREKIIYTVPSRRAEKCIPSRPVVTVFTCRPVPSSQFLLTVPSPHETKRSLYCTVPSRRENHTRRPVPSHLGNCNFHYFTVPSRLQTVSRQTCQNSTAPSRLEYYQP